jgi:hypothetical protein
MRPPLGRITEHENILSLARTEGFSHIEIAIFGRPGATVAAVLPTEQLS